MDRTPVAPETHTQKDFKKLTRIPSISSFNDANVLDLSKSFEQKKNSLIDIRKLTS